MSAFPTVTAARIESLLRARKANAPERALTAWRLGAICDAFSMVEVLDGTAARFLNSDPRFKRFRHPEGWYVPA